MSYLASRIGIFLEPGNKTYEYAIVDEGIVAEALEGLTPAQVTAVNSYRWVPTAAQVAAGWVPSLVGKTPAECVYFRAKPTEMRQALRKRWIG